MTMKSKQQLAAKLLIGNTETTRKIKKSKLCAYGRCTHPNTWAYDTQKR